MLARTLTSLKTLSQTQVRYLLLPPLALTLVHLVSYRKLPFDPGYQFPLISFLTVLGICIICCEVNTYTYHHALSALREKVGMAKTTLRQMSASILVTAMTFGFLVYTLNYLVFGIVAPFSRFASSLFVALLIICVETLFFILRDLRLSREDKSGIVKNVQWTFKTGKRTVQIPIDSIAYVYSSQGMVYVVTKNGEKHLSDFSSLNELSDTQDTTGFFQVNRQFITRREAISSTLKDVNQKIKVQLTPSVNTIPDQVTVSRYKGPEFKRWLQS